MKIFSSLFIILNFGATLPAQIVIRGADEVKKEKKQEKTIETQKKVSNEKETILGDFEDNAESKSVVVEKNEPKESSSQTTSKSTTTVSTPKTQASTTNKSAAGDMPPNAEPGKCYARCLIPNQFDYKTQRLVDRPQIIKKVKLPQLIKEVYDTVVISPKSVQNLKVPAEYETIEERIMVEPASTKWVKGKADEGCLSSDPEDCQVMCLVEIPAKYKTVKRKVLKTEAYTKTIEVPMEYKVVAKEVVVREESFEDIVIPPTYKTVQERYVSKEGGYQEWREILCGDQLTANRIRTIQQALKDAGYDPGPIDNILGSKTKEALKKYQTDKGLPVGNLNMETMQALGVQ